MTNVCVIGIYVHDMEKALDFYCKKLGFKMKRIIEKDCLVQLENDGPTLILEKVKKAGKTAYPGESQIALGIETKNLDATVSKLKALGIQFLFDSPQPFAAGQFMVTRDPSGNIIEFLEFS